MTSRFMHRLIDKKAEDDTVPANNRTRSNHGWLVDWSVGWLVGRSVGWLVGWFGLLVSRLVGWSVGRMVGWSVRWLVCWLVDRSVSRMAG